HSFLSFSVSLSSPLFLRLSKHVCSNGMSGVSNRHSCYTSHHMTATLYRNLLIHTHRHTYKQMNERKHIHTLTHTHTHTNTHTYTHTKTHTHTHTQAHTH